MSANVIPGTPLSLRDLRGDGQLPMVTAMVATYNYERYLPQALDSALAQDYPADRLEIVVVDDGSTDGTPELLERYRAAHPDRIRVIRQANAGNKAAANAAVSAARGDVLAMLDADDTWPVQKTRRQVRRLLEDPTLGLVYCDQEIIDSENRVLRPSRFAWLEHQIQRGPGAFAQMMGPQGNIAVNSTIMFRRELAEHLFPIPLRMRFQDWWIVSWASTLAGIDCVEDLKIGYRVHGENGTLGGTGARRVWGTCKTTESRRQMLVHGGGDLLEEDDLLAAWQAWEDEAARAGEFAGSHYLPLVEADDSERAAATRHAARAANALAAADRLGALRAQVRALACDPAAQHVREGLMDLAWATGRIGRRDPSPVPELRRVATVCSLADLLAEPTLLSGYASAVTEADDATLVVISRGIPVARLLESFSRRWPARASPSTSCPTSSSAIARTRPPRRCSAPPPAPSARGGGTGSRFRCFARAAFARSSRSGCCRPGRPTRSRSPPRPAEPHRAHGAAGRASPRPRCGRLSLTPPGRARSAPPASPA